MTQEHAATNQIAWKTARFQHIGINLHSRSSRSCVPVSPSWAFMGMPEPFVLFYNNAAKYAVRL